MNAIKPDLMWIEGRCYRMNESVADGSFNYEQDSYDYESKMSDSGNEGDEEYEVTMVNERYKTNFHVPKPYFGSIIGKKGATKMRLEKETRTEIKIPRPGQDGDIVILGSSPAAVKTARRRINMVVFSAKMRQKPTHFISIPCNNTEIKDNFNKFKQQVLTECSSSSGLEESIFIAASKLHVTAGVMTLMDNEERAQAAQVFQSVANEVIKSHFVDGLKLRVRLQGLSYMNDEPKRVNVLFSNLVEEEGPNGILQNICNDLYKKLINAGLVKREFDRDFVKLHVTLLNTRYRGKEQLVSHSDSEDSPERPRRRPFDATQILDKFANYDFGVAEVTAIHLSQMGAYDDEGYYIPTSVVTCAPGTT